MAMEPRQSRSLWEWAPLLLVPSAVLFEYGGLDLAIAARFFDESARVWTYREHWLAAGVLHDGAQGLLLVLGGLLVLATVAALFVPRLRHLRVPLGYVLLAGLIGPLVVGAIKGSTHVYIPWDLELFGGTRPYVRLFDPAPAGLPVGRAFPAAHAAGGYTWLCLFFLASRYRPSARPAALLLPLLAGLLLGGAQQVRGAHLVSHDLITIAICWFSALAVDRSFEHLGLWPPAPVLRT
ncbi:MAG: phosphatase PAP2 family protein [Planctomycetota bacterium]|nr:phosphatase PAP2 family protein [Planctomycetota bacterium]